MILHIEASEILIGRSWVLVELLEFGFGIWRKYRACWFESVGAVEALCTSIYSKLGGFTEFLRWRNALIEGSTYSIGHSGS